MRQFPKLLYLRLIYNNKEILVKHAECTVFIHDALRWTHVFDGKSRKRFGRDSNRFWLDCNGRALPRVPEASQPGLRVTDDYQETTGMRVCPAIFFRTSYL